MLVKIGVIVSIRALDETILVFICNETNSPSPSTTASKVGAFPAFVRVALNVTLGLKSAFAVTWPTQSYT